MSDAKFYTGRGDQGTTGRLGGRARVLKSSVLMQAVGALDEATCVLGVARARVQEPIMQEALPEVQRRLYRLMAHLSATEETRARYAGLDDADVAWLEGVIEGLEAQVPPVHEFVLPGDSESGAACHMARAVIRRAEREMVALSEAEAGISAGSLAFVNRLSSLMFVAALREDALAHE